MKCVFYTEWAKLRENKPLFISIIAIIAVFIVLTLFLYAFTKPDYKQTTVTNDEYEQLKSFSYLTPEDADKILYYETLYNANLTGDSYYENKVVVLQDNFSMGGGQDSIAYVWQLLRYFGAFMCVFAILTVLSVFSRDIWSGAIKHIAAADVPREKLFLGKALFAFALLSAIYLFYVIFTSLICVGSFGIKVFFIINSGAKLTNFGDVYFARALESYFAVIAALSMTFACVSLAKNRIGAAAVPIIIFAVLGAFYKIFTDLQLQNSFQYQPFFYNYIPYFSTSFGTHFGFGVITIFSTLFYLAFTAISILISRKRFHARDF